MHVHDEKNVHFRIMKSFHKIKKLMTKVSLSDGLTSSEFYLLATLFHRYQGSCSVMNVSSIAEEMGISLPAVSKSLSNLEQKGYIERSVDPNNRRNTWVNLTEAGKETANNTHNRRKDLMTAIVKKMGSDNFEELTRLVEILAETFEAALNEKEKHAEHD